MSKRITKVEAEKLIAARINENGGVDWYAQMWGEGHQRNNIYYCIHDKNGGESYITNPSQDFCDAVHIKYIETWRSKNRRWL